MRIPENWIIKFYADPVFAAYAIIGVRLDWFQRVRLRYLWFTPNKVDSSGWSTGKTLVEWIYAVLRAVLIPNQRVGVYYPVFQTGKDEFWRYFSVYTPDTLASQYLPGRDAQKKDPGCWKMHFLNGSSIEMPAPGFTQDAKNQASRRFNTMIIGEYTQAATKGEGVDELIGRVSAPNWNKNHPIWCNHYLLSAHAEDSSHPAYRYYKAVLDPTLGKATAVETQQNVTISFCYLDWSDRPIDPDRPTETFRKKFRDDAAIRRTMRSASRAKIQQSLFGIWASDSTGWYTAASMAPALRDNIVPIVARGGEWEDAIFTLGVDLAPGMSDKADQCAFVVDGARRAQPGERPSWIAPDNTPWVIAPVYAYIVRDADSVTLSGFIHALHWRFGFSRIVLDPGGGGAWLYKEMRKGQQMIDGTLTSVTPLMTIDEPLASEGSPIVVFFKRGSELDQVWQKNFLSSDEGIIEAAHRLMRESFAGGMCWPQLLANRAPAQARMLTGPVRAAQVALDTVYRQLQSVMVKTMKDSDGVERPVRSSKGFFMFTSKIKKDAAYAKVYARAGLQLALQGPANASVYEDVIA